MGSKRHIFYGTIVSPVSLNQLDITEGFLAVEDGKITEKGSLKEYNDLKQTDAFNGFEIHQLSHGQFLMPGFVDCHTHAPQFPNIGLGLDCPLLEWLNKYTFPIEARYKSEVFASLVYDKIVPLLLNNGTTTACYFGSLHLGGTLELVKSVIKHKQRALIGKVSMNIKNDEDYYNNTETELKEVEEFVQKVMAYKNDLIQPVVTPRFAVSCDRTLMEGLAEISEKYNCPIQSHISENKKEIEIALQLHPGCKSYGDVYDKCKLLNERCIMAHAIHLEEEEIDLLAEKRVSIAHCPASNTRLRSGLCPVRKYLDRNITVGLGTDVSGGDSATMLDAIRRTMDVSTHLDLLQGGENAISWTEAVYLATLGGAKALNLDHKIGSFEVGKEFDGLVINAWGGQLETYQFMQQLTDYKTHLVQRFVYLGDDRNIGQVYVKGELVKTDV